MYKYLKYKYLQLMSQTGGKTNCDLTSIKKINNNYKIDCLFSHPLKKKIIQKNNNVKCNCNSDDTKKWSCNCNYEDSNNYILCQAINKSGNNCGLRCTHKCKNGKYCGIHKNYNSNKNLKNIIKNKDKNIKSNRSSNKLNEKDQLNFLEDNINNNTEIGIKFKNSYTKKFDKIIKNIKILGKNNDHYDILINHTDKTYYRCELKSTEKILNLENIRNPWYIGVQALNIFGKTLGEDFINIYLEKLYKIIYKNDNIKKTLNLENELPEFDKFKKDILAVNPKTPFIIEFKNKLKEKSNGNNYYSQFKKNYVTLFNKVNIEVIKNINDNIKKIMIKNIQEKLNESFNQKDIWLNISGDLKSNNFTFKWWNHIKSPQITEIILSPEKNGDIVIKYIL